jgi:4-hydroxybenzoate polyprenyltransferase
VLTALLNLLGILLAFSLSPLHGLLAIAIATLLILYSIWLKNSVLWGNMLIGLISAAAFPYGALSQQTIGRAWIPAAFALLFHLGREIIKDIEDMAGDRLRGENTLPLRWGRMRAAKLASIIYLCLIALTLLPFIQGIYASVYLFCVGPADALVLYVLYRLYRERADLQHDLLGRLLKIGMFAGLLAIVAGELSRGSF